MTNDWKAQIASHVSICHGKVCIKNTRVMLSVIPDCVAEGITEEEILKEYPSLKEGAVSIALQYATSLARGETTPLKVES